MKTIIIGGGVAGCCSALFLRRIGIEVAIYEAYPSPPAVHVGAGLGLAANGLNTIALYSDALAGRICSRGYKAGFYDMMQSDGTRLGSFPAGREGRYGKYGTIMIKRWDVHDVLLKEMESSGCPIQYGRRATKVEETPTAVRVTFEDGNVEEADLLIGADGVRSIIRDVISPSSKVSYTGLVGVGGFIQKAEIGQETLDRYFPQPTDGGPPRAAVMTFGSLGFFGAAPCDGKTPSDGGDIMWWSTFEATERPPSEYITFDKKLVLDELQKRHGKWHEPIPTILKLASNQKISVLPNYDMSSITTYHTSRIVLVGDAAHIVQPHTGQGVSQAVEDVACLTQQLLPFAQSSKVDSEDLKKALSKYESIRKPRVDKVLEQGRKVGDQKRKKGPVATFVFKWMFKFFLSFFLSEKSMDDAYTTQFTEDIFGPDHVA